MTIARPLRFFLATTLGLLLGTAGTASAQSQHPPHRSPRRDYHVGNRHLVETRDPLDHSAYLDVGFNHDRQTSSVAGTQRTSFVPMRLGVDLPVADHLQLRVNAGLAGLVDSLSGAGALDYRERVFRPANVEVGMAYAMGFGGSGGEPQFTLYAGGTLMLPTAQLPKNASASDAARTNTAYIGALGVNGMQRAWLYEPESWGLVPGATGRFVYGPIFVNASLDVALLLSTDDSKPVHFAQVRAEAGYRVEDSFRLGVGLTDVVAFGPGRSGLGIADPFGVIHGYTPTSDHAQTSVRLFLRTEFAALTFGEEFVLNLGEPFGNSFQSGRVWGLISTLGLAL